LRSAPVIIGGGPAGSAAAIELARAGHQVTLIERTPAASDKLCGDFLSSEAISRIAALGIDIADAAPIDTLRLIHGRRVATTRLPFVACGLSRRVLDEALLRHAAEYGATVLRGHRVNRIEAQGAALRIHSASLGQISADTVFLATGKHELRSHPRRTTGSRLVGLKMYYRLAAPQHLALSGHIELMLLPCGYAGLQRIEADRAVLCLLLNAARLRSAGGRWAMLINKLMQDCLHLGERLAGAQALLERPLGAAKLPYGYVYRPQHPNNERLYRLGDQAAVIPSLTGTGVALALASGHLAARTWLSRATGEVYHRLFAANVAPQMRVAAAVHGLSLSPIFQPWLVAMCCMWPGLMGVTAAITRTRSSDGLPG
jgi:flavin-dependent dehydrogenase